MKDNKLSEIQIKSLSISEATPKNIIYSEMAVKNLCI